MALYPKVFDTHSSNPKMTFFRNVSKIFFYGYVYYEIKPTACQQGKLDRVKGQPYKENLNGCHLVNIGNIPYAKLWEYWDFQEFRFHVNKVFNS
jgi:hypothetical protein